MADGYDVVVVGAGPGGAVAALSAAEKGLRVLLVERKRVVGVPVRCAEGVSSAGLERFIRPSPRWVASTLEGAALYSPDGTRVDIKVDGRGYILERAVFDRELVRLAAEKGTEVLLGAYVDGLVTRGNRVAGITYRDGSGRGEVKCAVVIAADGVESRLARLAGIDTVSTLHDMETCYQYGLLYDGICSDKVELFFGRDVAPGGYAWVFSKGNGLANVGLGITGEHARRKSSKEYLDDFVARRFPGAKKLYQVAGGVPLGRPPRRLVKGGFMVVGDAARQVNPMSGAGILNAMIAGKLAGETAYEAHAAGDFSGRFLRKYEKRWHDRLGRDMSRYYKIKEVVSRLPDDVLNKTAAALNRLEPDERTLFQAFRITLRNYPRLLLELTHLF